jgi:hypothetical protein
MAGPSEAMGAGSESAAHRAVLNRLAMTCRRSQFFKPPHQAV